jgi:hypothetical protein
MPTVFFYLHVCSEYAWRSEDMHKFMNFLFLEYLKKLKNTIFDGTNKWALATQIFFYLIKKICFAK